MSRWIAVCCKHIIHRGDTTIVQPSLSSQHMCPHTVVGAWWKTQKPFTLLQSAPEANLAANPTFVQLADANIQHIVRGSALGVHHLWRALAFELFCPLVVVEIENQFGRKALSSPCLISAEGGRPSFPQMKPTRQSHCRSFRELAIGCFLIHDNGWVGNVEKSQEIFFVRDGFHVGGKPACIKVRLTTGLKRRQELVAHLRDQQQLLYFCAVFLPTLPLYLYFYPFYSYWMGTSWMPLGKE